MKEHLCAMDYQMIYLRRKLLKAARNMAQGIEPTEPWTPAAWHYHSATAPIENGDYDAAIARAKQLGKTSPVPSAARQTAAAPAIAVS